VRDFPKVNKQDYFTLAKSNAHIHLQESIAQISSTFICSIALQKGKKKKSKHGEKRYGHTFKLCLLQEKILCLNSNYTILPEMEMAF